MSSRTTPTREHEFALTGRALGDATAYVLELSRNAGYSVAATAPGTYRLARERRYGLRKRSESVVVTVLDDRRGPRVRFVGPIDPAIIDCLTPRGTETPSPAQREASPADTTPPLRSVDQTPPPSPASTAPPALPRPHQRPAASVSSPTGLIGSVPGITGTLPGDETRSWPAGVESLDDRRNPLVEVPARAAPTLVFPDGRTILPDSVIVIGRDPDLGDDPSAVAVAVADPSLSKTHARVECTEAGLTITDLHSTNGSTVVTDGVESACPADHPVDLPPGAVLLAGALRIEVRA